jgi:cobalt/nickel transport system ATP-binding protein
MNPEILVLDEPTANLDPKGVRDILGIIKHLNQKQNITVVLATHNVNIVPELTDEIYVMHRGHILARGNPLEIFQNEKLLRKANLEIPELSKLIVRLRNSGYDVDFALTLEDAYEAVKKKMDDGNA